MKNRIRGNGAPDPPMEFEYSGNPRMNPSSQCCALVLLLLVTPPFLLALEPLKPVRIETPPSIDGKLDDHAWQVASLVDRFTTFSPDFAREPSQKTVTLMAYDPENLYFAFRCYDTDPGKIKASVTSRDNIQPDDWICINLDSFNDQQSLYALYVNPVGIQMDSRYAANQEDFSVDLVWYSGGHITDDGYVVEVCIPLKSIRYAESDPVTMSVFFERKISRTSEHGSYPPMDPAKGYAFLTQMSPMVYHGLQHLSVLEVLPAFTYGQKYRDERGGLVSDERTRELSITAKYGIASNLTVDGTFNPDFSQIEADAGQVDVNLRYALYYIEKRPFFLEGSETYTLAATQMSEVDPLRSVVHTRTIIDPLAGVKLTGKLGSKTTIASLYAIEELPEDESAYAADYAHVPIIRVKQALAEDSYIGGIYAGRELRGHHNRLIGVDAMHRITSAGMLDYHGLLSYSREDPASMQKSGYAWAAQYSYSARDLDYKAGFVDISDAFRTETGYLTRTGVRSVTALVRPKFYPDSEIIQRIDAEIFSAQTQDRPSRLWETFNHISAQCLFLGTLTAKVKYSYCTEVFAGEQFKTGGLHFLLEGQLTKELSAGILYRRVGAVYYADAPYQGYSNRLTVEVVVQPSSHIESVSSVLFSDFYRTSDSHRIYEYPIFRERLTFQVNKYLFFRGVLEYNRYRSELLTDFLASFTYVPGTVIHLGYGSLYQKSEWQTDRYVESGRFHEMKRGVFFKMSYLWRA